MTFLQLSRTGIHRLAGLFWIAALGFWAVPASAQVFPFSLRLSQGTVVSTIPNQSTVTLVAPGSGKAASATLTITNLATQATITSVPVVGQVNQDFSATLGGSVPLVLNTGDAVNVPLQFSPSTTQTETALLTIPFSQGGVSGSILLNLVGVTATYTVSYTLPTNQNTVPLPAGGTLQFPPTQLNASITASVAISNTGAGQITVSDISIPSGTPFQIVSKPFLPFNLNPGLSLVFGVKYSPTQATTDSGSLSLTVSGTTSTYSLAGSGITSTYSYTITTDAGVETPITPNQSTNPVVFPDTSLGSTSSFFVKVRNTGGAVGSIPAIAATGAFSVTDGPAFFPVTMNPNDQITFTLTFTPVLPGKVTGRLTVGSDVFTLTGTGLGPKLTFAYGSSATTVLPTGTVVFSLVQVGQSGQQSFTVTNAGTSAATITSIAVADTKGVFKLVNQPSGTTTLNPGETLTFTIVFTPAVTGFATTTLQIDTNSFLLSGSGTAPPVLPAVQFTGASGTVAPLQQPLIGLSLSAPYSLPLTGVLTITMNPTAFSPDPSVQFVTGGKTVPFTIPANTTDAIFSTGSNQIGLQAGTTAGAIIITPSFATQSGLDLTPVPPPTLTLTVPSAAPQLLTVHLSNVTQVGFSVSVSGLTTTHSLQTLTYTFAPTGSGKPSSYTLEVAGNAGLWFTSAASQPFGGQFSVAVPFTIPNPSTTALSTANLKSVSVTAANAQGTSAAVSLPVQ
jgi:Abnormal spindle-like microcephaly-assoc'd, ASPM-SPD-2-Hydin